MNFRSAKWKLIDSGACRDATISNAGCSCCTWRAVERAAQNSSTGLIACPCSAVAEINRAYPG